MTELNGGDPAAASRPPARTEAAAAPQAATVRICLNGTAPGIEAALRVLRGGIFDEGYEISRPSRPYPNRREPGHRVYVTLWFPEFRRQPGQATRQPQAEHLAEAGPEAEL